MQGISLINDLNGNPAVLTIDLRNLDPDVSPLVAGLLERVKTDAESDERVDWLHLSAINLERAYGDNEPDYNEADLLASNPNYRL